MAAGTVRVEGLRELQAAFRKTDRKLVKEFGDELKETAEPIARSSRERIARYGGASLGTLRTRRRGLTTIYVEQGARKVTGRRADFGRLQKRHMEEALDDGRDGVLTDIDRALGRWAGEAGF